MVSPLSRRDAEGPEETAGLLSSNNVELEHADDSSLQETPPLTTASSSSSTAPPVATKPAGPIPCTIISEGKGIDMVSLCRICLEEDEAQNLEIPCSCSGTQRWAHHACIQQWVSEKGNLRCEVCGTDYKGQFDVPPPPPPSAVPTPLLAPMFILNPESAARIAATRHQIQVLEEQEEYQQRHPGIQCIFTTCVFILFLVVMHHTMVVADGQDDMGYPPVPNPPPFPAGDPGQDDVTLFLFWAATKAIFIGIPLWIMLRVAARQARREQYEAMLRGAAYGGGGDSTGRRMVFRMQPPQTGINAV